MNKLTYTDRRRPYCLKSTDASLAFFDPGGCGNVTCDGRGSPQVIRTKYFQRVRQAQQHDQPLESLPPFDLQRLRGGRFGTIVKSLLPDNPRRVLSVLRRWLPVLKLGGLTLLSRNDDVREVLERQDAFETPFGLEMAEMAGGSNFILGMQDGPGYRAMKSAVLTAFPPAEVVARVRPIAARQSREIMRGAMPGANAVEQLLKIVPVQICRDYYGLTIDDENEFADWAIALSALFFGDPFGSRTKRELALVAAHRMREAIDRSIETVAAEAKPADTPLARLVAMHKSDPDRVTTAHVRSIMMGMVTGFIPTNLLAAGKALDAALSIPEAKAAVEEALAAGDDEALDAAILESMRFNPALPAQFRYVPRDTVIAAGTRRERRLPAGSTVACLMQSAMFDPDAVDEPDAFRPGRPAKDYLVFGHGIHWCIGSAIAKVQIGECFRALFAKPGLRRTAGRAGRLRFLGPFPESLCVDFDLPAESRVVDHAFVTVAAPVREGVDIAALRGAVAQLGNPPQADIRAAFDATGIVHFASLSVIGRADPAEEQPDDRYHLVFEFTADGPKAEAIAAVARHARPILWPIFRDGCGLDNEEELQPFLLRHAIDVAPGFHKPAGLCFAGVPGHSVARIRAEAALGGSVMRQLEEAVPGGPLTVAEKLERVTQRLAADGSREWVFQPAPDRLSGPQHSAWAALWGLFRDRAFVAGLVIAVLAFSLPYYAGLFAGLATGVVSAFLLFLAAIPLGATTLALLAFAVFWLGRRALNAKEKSDPVHNGLIPPERFAPIAERENFWAHNHLAAISEMKGGWLRGVTLRTAFFAIAQFARNVFSPGHLADIGSIHFARWVLLPGTGKLLFFSNYGGSWESYLEDFVVKAHAGLTAVWSNAVGFPRARDLFWEGASDGPRFKRWARAQQVPTLFWYSAYPDLTTGHIRANARLRRAIALNDAAEWRACLGAEPDAATPIETAEVQSIFFRGMGDLEAAEMLAVAIPDCVPMANRRKWLGYVVSKLAFGDAPPDERAMIAAFSAQGLARLGLDNDAALATLPLSFRRGMSRSDQSRVLGDVGRNDPGNWEWGHGEAGADVVLVCYAKDGNRLKADVASLMRRTRSAGLAICHRLPLTIERDARNKAIEHFGYRDNISQPMIAGTPRARRPADPQHRVAAGEFLLGYADETGRLPPSIAVREAAAERQLRDMPDNPGWADFGRNGSFLVVRQMAQHVDAFEDYCRREAQRLAAMRGHDGCDKDWIGAKMMGRWKDGGSIVRHGLSEPGREPDNHFSYTAEDPDGRQCPYGAHVRRANPRDSLGPDRETQIALSKRHRILRIGRTYLRPGGRGRPAEKGMLFMCLNAEIERQFEFVQQSWVMRRSFQSLTDEGDPFVGNPQGNGTFTIPDRHGPLVLKGLDSFVTVRGGGYFFMPGRAALAHLLARLSDQRSGVAS
ncbi:cytochrome P450 [Mesorhizobium xinjiangense]|uniref:cytochrome P450 n=1 Tax=Mesorhizobium xinjiangense TaxID=2678685 RepID=UPI001F1E8E4C|nr:cytochrome P450 [Mesorhizobium xinjiangense]